MCGIAGIHCRNNRPVHNLDLLARELLRAIEPRGRDATGWLTLEDNGHAVLRKDVLPAHRFIDRMKREVKRWGLKRPEHVRTLMLHTRFATVGDARNPRNAHPHVSKSIAAVHNGTIYNADELFQVFEMPRHATVDSEVVPALVEAFGWDAVDDALEMLDGGAALAIINQRRPRELVLARVEAFPLVWVATRDYVIWASTADAILKACDRAGIKVERKDLQHLGDGDLVHVKRGKIMRRTFRPLYTTMRKKPKWKPTSKSTVWNGNGKTNVNVAPSPKRAPLRVVTEQEAARMAAGYPMEDEALEHIADIIREAEEDRRHGAARGHGARKGIVVTKSPATLADEALARRESKA